MTPIVNVGYRSTNYWVIGGAGGRLLLDLGWPGSMGSLRAALNRAGVPMSEIRYGLATHYHIDHAGCAQELKQCGVKLLVMETQVEAIPGMKRYIKPQDHYLDITLHDNVALSFTASRTLLASLGLDGRIVPTPGHSDDSVSLLLDEGAAFTGDLTHPNLLGEDGASQTGAASWRQLFELGATHIYPGHGTIYAMDRSLVPG